MTSPRRNKITQNMVDAGCREFRNYVDPDIHDPITPVSEIVMAIYRAMCRAEIERVGRKDRLIRQPRLKR